MKIVDCKQGTSEWFQARTGKVTASEVKKVMAFGKRGDKKGEPLEARNDYQASLLAEIVSNTPDMEGYLSQCMKDGKDREPQARAAYELRTERVVDTVGFVLHPSIPRYGASPDGLIGAEGGLEIKCPKLSTHLKWIMSGVPPVEHLPQVYANMDCAERDWWDLASFCPLVPEPLDLFIWPIMYDQAQIEALQEGVIQFNKEIDEMIARLKDIVGEFRIPAAMAAKSDPLLSGLGLSDEDIARYI